MIGDRLYKEVSVQDIQNIYQERVNIPCYDNISASPDITLNKQRPHIILTFILDIGINHYQGPFIYRLEDCEKK